MKQRLIALFFLLALSVPAVWLIIEPGYFPIHDDTQIVRVNQMYQALRQGQFPVRFVNDLGYGYGYPIFNFYNPLPYYFGAFFMFLNLNAVIATKIMFVFPIILSGFTIFWLVSQYFSQLAALASALFYIYAPYHAVQIYVRGAVAEYWAYAFFPLLIMALLNQQPLLAGIVLALLILSHNLTALMIIPILAILFLIKLFFSKSKAALVKFLLSVCLIGLSLSAFFWLPALLEKNLTQLNQLLVQQSNPLDHFVFLPQLWTSLWGFGGSVAGIHDGISFMAGKLHLILSLLSLPIIFISTKLNKKMRLLLLFSFCSLFFALFMTLPLSYPVWSNLPILDIIQFPWRWLIFFSLFTSVLSGFSLNYFHQLITKHLNHKVIIIIGSLLAIGFVIYSSKFFKPQYKFPFTLKEALAPERVTWTVSQRSDEYLPQGFIVPQTKEEALGSKNPLNQKLINDFIQPNPLRTTANYISLASILWLILQLFKKRFKLLVK